MRLLYKILRQEPGSRDGVVAVTSVLGIIVNVLIAALKVAIGIFASSIAILSSGVNNATDALTSVLTLVGTRLSAKRPDAKHPFGHGRIEYLAGLAVSLLILLVGVELGKSSVDKILQPETTALTPLAAGVLIASILVKLWMGWFNGALGRKTDSAALNAASLDARTDALATSAVLVGLVISRLTPINLDGWLGLAVAVFILRAGWSAARDTIDPLLGAQPDPDVVADIEALILSHPPVLGIHDLVIHDYGPGRRMMSVHAEVPARSELVEVHDVIDHIERELGERFGLEAVIHLDPVEPEDPYTRRLLSLASQAARELDPAATIHDLRRTPEGEVSFDVVAPYDVALTDEEVRAALTRRLEELEPGLRPVIGVDRSHVL